MIISIFFIISIIIIIINNDSIYKVWILKWFLKFMYIMYIYKKTIIIIIFI